MSRRTAVTNDNFEGIVLRIGSGARFTVAGRVPGRSLGRLEKCISGSCVRSVFFKAFLFERVHRSSLSYNR